MQAFDTLASVEEGLWLAVRQLIQGKRLDVASEVQDMAVVIHRLREKAKGGK